MYSNALNIKVDKSNSYLKTDINVFVLSMLQAGILNRVLIHTVYINGQIKTHTTASNIYKIQKQQQLEQLFTIH